MDLDVSESDGERDRGSSAWDVAMDDFPEGEGAERTRPPTRRRLFQESPYNEGDEASDAESDPPGDHAWNFRPIEDLLYEDRFASDGERRGVVRRWGDTDTSKQMRYDYWYQRWTHPVDQVVWLKYWECYGSPFNGMHEN